MAATKDQLHHEGHEEHEGIFLSGYILFVSFVVNSPCPGKDSSVMRIGDFRLFLTISAVEEIYLKSEEESHR
jgi:hypothetical protein